MGKPAGLDGLADSSAVFDTMAKGRWTRPFLAGLAVATAMAMLLAGALVAFQLVHTGTVFPGVRVGDTPVGGMSKERALSELRPRFAEMENRRLLLQMPDGDREVRVLDLGASFDAQAAVDAAFAVGRSGSLADRLAAQLGALLHGYSVESPGVRIDRSKLLSYLTQCAQEIDRQVKDAELVIGPDLSVRITPSVVGRKLDVASAVEAVERAISAGAPSVALPVAETQPKRVEKELEEARSKLSTMLSGPVALQFEGRQWTLSAKEIASLVTVDQKVGIPVPTISIQEQPLRQMVDKIAAEIDQPKMNARYDWNGGNLKLLREGQDGRKVDKEKALAALKSAISGSGAQRVVALPVEVEKAVRGTVDPSKLGIKERIEFGQTTVTGVPEKVHNIKLAASRLNGVLLAPGDTFSFNKELGPTTLKSGYQTGFGISVNNGQMETVPSVAGGICQVATTLLHAVFWAGYQIEERYPHLYWIPNYGRPPRGMVGLDATVDDPTLDFKFVNNTDNYLLIQSKVEDNILEFDLYGTKPNWKVEVEGPIITNVVKADPTTVRQEEPSWPEGKQVWVESATDGMDVDIIRRVIQGSDVRTLHLKSRYQPSRNVLMVGTKKPEPTPSPTPAGAASSDGRSPQPGTTAVPPLPTSTPASAGSTASSSGAAPATPPAAASGSGAVGR